MVQMNDLSLKKKPLFNRKLGVMNMDIAPRNMQLYKFCNEIISRRKIRRRKEFKSGIAHERFEKKTDIISNQTKYIQHK